MKRNDILISLIILIILLCGCEKTETGISRTDTVIGTVVTVTAYGENAEAGIEAAFAEAERLEKIFSFSEPNSELAIFNKSVSEDGRVSDELYGLTVTALEYGRLTGGAFDPALGRVIDLWGIGTEKARIPEEREIQKYLEHRGIEAGEGNLLTRRGAAWLHLGAIAKGYIGDKMKQAVLDAGVTSAIMNLGGNVVAVGAKPDGSAFRVGITDPEMPQQYLKEPVLEVADRSVVTSGGYERYFEEDGVRYQHILDPKTGYPVQTDLLSVTVAAKDGALADAMSTALFVMGFEKAKAFVESGAADIDYAILILESGELYQLIVNS